jgi:peptidoglycan/LPS O-acetylase OafA/YrhL
MSEPTTTPPMAVPPDPRSCLAPPERNRAGVLRHLGRSVSLEQAAEQSRGTNNFDLLRLLAAVAVIFAHSFDLVQSREPFTWATGYSWGDVGVMTFFAISGFLVSRSWDRRPELLEFALRRALRLLPGLIVAVLLTALVLGPLVTSVPVGAYLRDPQTKDYVISNAVLQTRYVLPGVFNHLPFPSAVNGSLWTLPVEVKAYALVALLGCLGVFRRARWILPLLAIAVLSLTARGVVNSSPAAHAVAALIDIQMPKALVLSIQHGALSDVPEVFAAFLMSAALYAFRARILLRWDLAVLCLMAIGAAGFAPGQWPTAVPALLCPYVILCLAYLTPSARGLSRRIGDPSYGLYIYAFPIQQTLIEVLKTASSWLVFLTSLPLTLIAAVASWRLVEVRALALKTRVTGGEAPPGIRLAS